MKIVFRQERTSVSFELSSCKHTGDGDPPPRPPASLDAQGGDPPPGPPVSLDAQGPESDPLPPEPLTALAIFLAEAVCELWPTLEARWSWLPSVFTIRILVILFVIGLSRRQ